MWIRGLYFRGLPKFLPVQGNLKFLIWIVNGFFIGWNQTSARIRLHGWQLICDAWVIQYMTLKPIKQLLNLSVVLEFTIY